MMELTAQTIELMQFGIYSAALVFLGMLLLNGVTDLALTMFGGE